MVYSALFNSIFKAVNVFFNKYVAEIQLTGNSIWLPYIPERFYREFWHGLVLEKNQKFYFNSPIQNMKMHEKSTSKSTLIQFRWIVPDARPTTETASLVNCINVVLYQRKVKLEISRLS